jgi:hypothetical protein
LLLLRHEAQCYIARAAGRDERRYLSRDPARLGASLEEFVGHPAYGARTWTGSSSCSAATTASPCSALTRQGEAMTAASAAARD